MIRDMDVPRSFKVTVILFEVGFLMAAICGVIVAASDRIEDSRKRAADVKAYNASIERMVQVKKEMQK